MASRRVHPAAIAAASDGSVLINVISLLPMALQERLGKHLGGTPPIFLGVPLAHKDAEEVVARLDDAAAEASARVLGRSAAKSKASKRPRAAKR